MRASRPQKLSVVIPCYRSAHSLGVLLPRLVRQCEALGVDFEIVCVDDGSPDGLAEVIRQARAVDHRIKLVRHFRNYGQHFALVTGFKHVTGDLVVTMDDDLQHPPEEIPKLLAALEGNDVVVGVPINREHGALQNLGSALMRLIVRTVFHPPAGFSASAFRLMKREVADQVAMSGTAYPYISGMILRLTNRVTGVPVEHHPRVHGRSTYTFWTLAKLASNLIVNFTTLPLRVLAVVGLAVSVVSFAFLLYVIGAKLFAANFQAGWPSLIVVISFFGGLNLLALAVVLEYLVRLLNEASGGAKPFVREREL
jgi:glycosyltransferase involved in cell wall biosynthesis